MKVITTFILLLLAVCLIAEEADSAAELMSQSYDLEAIRRYEAAIKNVQKLVSMDGANAFYKLRLAWLYYQSGQYSAAERYYIAAADLDPSLEALEGRMNACYAQKKWNETITAADDILKRFPNHYFAITSKAYAFYMRNDFAQAANFFRKALTVYPYNLEIMGYLLSAQMRSGDVQGGRQTLQKLKVYSPNNPFVLEYEK